MWMPINILILIFVIFSCSQLIDENLDDYCEGILYKAITHPTNKNLFIGCLHEKATVYSCKGENEIFDFTISSCVKEIAKNKDENPCKGIFSDIIPIPGNCTFYYYCEFERTFVRNCGEGYVFDRTTKSCIQGDEEECLNELETESTTEFESVTTTQSTTKTTDEQTEDTTMPILTESTTQEITTTEEITLPITHNSTLITTTQNPYTTTTRSDDIIISFQCPASGFGNIPHSIHCNMYYECNLGILNLRSCDEGLHFDAITLQCTTVDRALCGNLIRCR